MRRLFPGLLRLTSAIGLAGVIGLGHVAPVGATAAHPIRIYLLATHSVGGWPFAELVAVRRTVDPGGNLPRAALDALIAGPTPIEQSGDWPGRSEPLPALHSRVPAGTVIHGVRVRNHRARVDLGASFQFREDRDDPYGYVDRLAQVTYTLTALPGIDEVRLRKDGRRVDVPEAHEHFPVPVPYAMGRGSYTDLLPPVFVDTPAWGADPGSRIQITGNATVMAGRIRLALVDRKTGQVLARRVLSAPCPGCWVGPGGGPFSATLQLPAGSDPSDLRIRAAEMTKDGHARKVRETPIR